MTELKETIKTRYDRHRSEIALAFFEGTDPGEIAGVERTGDKHLNGEAVSKLVTDRGYVFYYKPRDCRSAELLGRINTALFGKSMIPEQITGDGYAFQKEVKIHLPENADEKAAFFEWMGRLTSVFYALGSTDMHSGNVICGEKSPVVIDTETVLCAKAEGMGGAGEFSVDYGEVFPGLAASVGECMVLPRFFGFTQTTPLIPGKGCGHYGYEEVFISGFRKGYLKIMEKKEEIYGILGEFADIPLRYLMRSTAGYYAKIHLYKKARNDEERESVLKKLEKGLSGEDLTRWKPVIDWEREIIKEGDIPFFLVYAGRKDLMGDLQRDAVVQEYLDVSPVDNAKQRMGRMRSSDMNVQCSYIRAGLKHIDGYVSEDGDPGLFYGNAEITSGSKERQEMSEQGFNADHVLTKDEAVSDVNEIIGKLWDERIELSCNDPGPCSIWHTPMIRGRVGSMFGLAEGFSGVALFANACAESELIKGEAGDKAEEMAAGCFRTMVTFAEYLLDKYPEKPEEQVILRRFNGGLDLKDGTAGLLWALKKCRTVETAAVERILKRCKTWELSEDTEEDKDIWKIITDTGPFSNAANHYKNTDILEGGKAGNALWYILDAEETKDFSLLKKAGVCLKEITERKKGSGCYKIFPGRRRQYFLPAFLRGSTGIAYVMLRYAESVCDGNIDHIKTDKR